MLQLNDNAQPMLEWWTESFGKEDSIASLPVVQFNILLLYHENFTRVTCDFLENYLSKQLPNAAASSSWPQMTTQLLFGHMFESRFLVYRPFSKKFIALK